MTKTARTPQDSGEYPQRPSYWANKVTRELFQSYAVQDMGHHAVLLVIHVAHAEDAARYQYPVRFWNSQLMDTLGFTSPKQLNEARRRAIERGWLQYDREHARAMGHYQTAIPQDVLRFDDATIAEYSRSPGGTGNGTEQHLLSPGGTRSGTGSGKPSYPIPIPNPSSCPEHIPDAAKSADFPTPTPEDTAAADWIWQRIHAMQPTRKRPDLAKWAHTIRLMRQQDRRTHAQILDLFALANADDFWQKNILSPEKLRTKWDDLFLKLVGNGSIRGADPKPGTISKPIPPVRR